LRITNVKKTIQAGWQGRYEDAQRAKTLEKFDKFPTNTMASYAICHVTDVKTDTPGTSVTLSKMRRDELNSDQTTDQNVKASTFQSKGKNGTVGRICTPNANGSGTEGLQ
jgi:hypothetical protein